MLLGIYYCGRAGYAREKQHDKPSGRATSQHYKVALAICILCGILAPSMTLALAFGAPLMTHAITLGVARANATYLIWDLVLPAGALISVSYCLLIISRNHSWNQFTLPFVRMNWALAIAMAV